MSSDEELFSLFQENILLKLEQRPFFLQAIAHNYKRIANELGSDVTLSARRMGEAHAYWREDVRRTIRHGMPAHTTELNSFKHAAFIAFWLRRTIPIEKIDAVWDPVTDTPRDGFRNGIEFFKYGNEICALLIGYQICFNYRAGNWLYDDSEISQGNAVTNVVSIERSLSKRIDYIRSIRFPTSLTKDYVRILKHKSNSPYGLYMMYRALLP